MSRINKRTALEPTKPDVPEGFTGLEWINTKYYLIGNHTPNWPEFERITYQERRYQYFSDWRKRDASVRAARIWTNGKIEDEFYRTCEDCILCRALK